MYTPQEGSSLSSQGMEAFWHSLSLSESSMFADSIGISFDYQTEVEEEWKIPFRGRRIKIYGENKYSAILWTAEYSWCDIAFFFLKAVQAQRHRNKIV